MAFVLVIGVTPVVLIEGFIPNVIGITYTDEQQDKYREIMRYFMIAGVVVGIIAGLFKAYRAYPVIGNSILATEYTHQPITTRVEDA
jgi:hypothetical protein